MNASRWLFSLMVLTAAAACVDFEEGYRRCFGGGRCLAADAGDGLRPTDAATDASTDAGSDAGAGGNDAGAAGDAGPDAGPDAGLVDAGPDAGAVDAGPPPQWRESHLSVPFTPNLRAVYAASPSDVWVAAPFSGSVLHFDGGAWQEGYVYTSTRWWGLAGSGPNDVWLVGDRSNIGEVAHWAGGAWTGDQTGWPRQTLAGRQVYGVWSGGPSTVWTVGTGGAIYQLDGGGFETVDSGIAEHFSSVVGFADAGELFAVGFSGVVAHQSGGVWRIQDAGIRTALNAVWGSSPRDVWVVGSTGGLSHWDGQAFTRVDAGVTRDLEAVWGTGPNDVWVVGHRGTALHWDGAVWQRSNFTSFDLFAVHGTGPQDVWAVGSDGGIYHYGP